MGEQIKSDWNETKWGTEIFFFIDFRYFVCHLLKHTHQGLRLFNRGSSDAVVVAVIVDLYFPSFICIIITIIVVVIIISLYSINKCNIIWFSLGIFLSFLELCLFFCIFFTLWTCVCLNRNGFLLCVLLDTKLLKWNIK